MGTTVTLTSNLYEEHQPIQLQPITTSSNDYSIFEDNNFTKETYQPFSSMCDISSDLTSLDAETMFHDTDNVLTIDTDTFSSANRSNSSLEYIQKGLDKLKIIFRFILFHFSSDISSNANLTSIISQ